MGLFFTRPDSCLHIGSFPLPRPVRMRIGGAPECMHALRALFLSDIHLRPGTPDTALQALMERIAAQNADLLLLGGDYAETPEACLRFFRALEKQHFPMGGFACPGNNDLESMPTLAETMARAGVTLLNNSHASLQLAGGTLLIGGCDDHKYGWPQTRKLFGDAAGYRILLSHFPVKPDCKCDLMLSGHTHAGQCNVLGITPYSVGFEHSYGMLGVRGFRHAGGMRTLISNGVGISRIPLRLGAEPQIYLLEFGSEDFI